MNGLIAATCLGREVPEAMSHIFVASSIFLITQKVLILIISNPRIYSLPSSAQPNPGLGLSQSRGEGGSRE